MHGIVTLLDGKCDARVKEIWGRLEEACGYTGIKAVPFPHFSWLIAPDFKWEMAERVMKEIATQTKPFSVKTTGVALFTKEQPTIYIPIVRTRALSIFHEEVWEKMQGIGIDLSPLYSPENWMPHITLVYNDATRENINCAMQVLAFQEFNWEIRVDNLTMASQNEGEVGTLGVRHQFKG